MKESLVRCGGREGGGENVEQTDIEREGRVYHEELVMRCGGGVCGGGKIVESDIGREDGMCHKEWVWENNSHLSSFS